MGNKSPIYLVTKTHFVTLASEVLGIASTMVASSEMMVCVIDAVI